MGGVGGGEAGFVAEEVSPRVDVVAEDEPTGFGKHCRTVSRDIGDAEAAR